MHPLSIALFVSLSLAAQAADYAREKKWADTVLPALQVGSPVWLSQADGHKFLGLHAEAGNPKAAVVLVHGLGGHPNDVPIQVLRRRLPESGYTTLSIQMPLLADGSSSAAYRATLPEAAERIKQSVAWLKTRGYRKVAIICHGFGCNMAFPFIVGRYGASVSTWVALGTASDQDWSRLKLPILDLYGAQEQKKILDQAAERARQLTQAGSMQIVIPAADHNFDGSDSILVDSVRKYLDSRL